MKIKKNGWQHGKCLSDTRRINKINNKLKKCYTNKLINDTIQLIAAILFLTLLLIGVRYIADHIEKDVSIKTTFYSEIRSQKPLYIKGFGTGSIAQSQEIQQELVRFEVFEKHRQEIEYQSKLEQLRVKQHQLEQQRLKKLALAKEAEKKQKRKEQVSRSNEKKYRTLIMEATAYDAFCNTNCIGITKTGYDVTNTVMYKDKFIVAVDPEIIPLHSIIKVEYEGRSFYAYALDIGKDIQKMRIDILMNSRAEAYDFGRKQVKVSIIRNGKGE